MPDLAGNGLNRGNRPRCGCSRDGAFKFHSRFELMNADLSAVDMNPGILRNLPDVANFSIVHLDPHVIAGYMFDDCSVDFDLCCPCPFGSVCCCCNLCRCGSRQRQECSNGNVWAAQKCSP